jgi:hypothetical protein
LIGGKRLAQRVCLTAGVATTLLVVPASVAAPAAVPSLAVAPGLVEYGRGEIVLSGIVPSKRAGEKVSILSLPCRFTEYAEIGTTTTRAGGEYRYRLQPMLNTRFRIRAGSAASRAVAVSVTPVVEVEKVGRGRYRVKVSTTNPVFQDGSSVLLQRAVGAGWVTAGRGTLKKASPETAITVESAVIIAAKLTGQVRAVLPAAQSKCYLAGTSKPING